MLPPEVGGGSLGDELALVATDEAGLGGGAGLVEGVCLGDELGSTEVVGSGAGFTGEGELGACSTDTTGG